MDESTEVVAAPPRMTVGELWNTLSCYGTGLTVTISWGGLVIDHRVEIPVPHEHLRKEE
jgi:hypothetical protein